MAVFFLLIGLEVKREIMEDNLSSWSQASLPVIAAVGGMAVPALIYIALNRGEPTAMLALGDSDGNRHRLCTGNSLFVRQSGAGLIKSISDGPRHYDDLGAIIIIAAFYTTDLSLLSMVIASVALLALVFINMFGVTKKAAYILLGIVLWVSVLKSGVPCDIGRSCPGLHYPIASRNKEGDTIFALQDN